MAKKITMQQIADELQMSKSLVSKALSNQQGVSEETKERVRLAAIRLGYRVNSSVMNIPASKTGIVAVLLPREDLSDIEYWGEIISNMELELSKQSFSMILSGVDLSLPSSEGIPNCIVDRKVDGALIMGEVPISYILAVQATGIPVILVDSFHYQTKLDHVLAENYSGGYDAARYLLDKGHRKIGFAGDIAYSASFSERYRGYKDAIRDYSAQNPGAIIEQTDMTSSREGKRIPVSTSQVLSCLEAKNRPSALVCANDPIAILMLQLMERLGLSCPEHVSLIGFDNLRMCEWVSPPLTSVDACKDRMGSRAVQLLFERLNNSESRPEHVMITTSIVERNSVNTL
ncbi:LacI family DNA-binding transcriptional regulator [Cohnella silvisoli]|uniref:LacI family DNA-binding transcriptional regulator n=1 Tax=Cohnella silvisoli TaxID=2873699 RepID=A0ABV1KMH3_9BACL|nr:LacI family DNA-binding transcriptional regulator [Cohnella silvisoli]MCD9020369.1 LacI family DNA-binding transcriptional regulator [Cohnella silvisoli]